MHFFKSLLLDFSFQVFSQWRLAPAKKLSGDSGPRALVFSEMWGRLQPALQGLWCIQTAAHAPSAPFMGRCLQQRVQGVGEQGDTTYC